MTIMMPPRIIALYPKRSKVKYNTSRQFFIEQYHDNYLPGPSKRLWETCRNSLPRCRAGLSLSSLDKEIAHAVDLGRKASDRANVGVWRGDKRRHSFKARYVKRCCLLHIILSVTDNNTPIAFLHKSSLFLLCLVHLSVSTHYSLFQ